MRKLVLSLQLISNLLLGLFFAYLFLSIDHVAARLGALLFCFLTLTLSGYFLCRTREKGHE